MSSLRLPLFSFVVNTTPMNLDFGPECYDEIHVWKPDLETQAKMELRMKTDYPIVELTGIAAELD